MLQWTLTNGIYAIRGDQKVSTAKDDKYLKELLIIFKAAVADLEANRRGEISESQKKHFQNAKRQTAIVIAIIAWVIAAGLYYFFYIGWESYTQELADNNMTLVVLVTLFFAILPTILVIVGLIAIYRWRKNTDAVVVSSLQGVIALKSYRLGRRNEMYEMYIESTKFPLSPDMYHILKDDTSHRIYYDDSSKHIYSIEPITS